MLAANTPTKSYQQLQKNRIRAVFLCLQIARFRQARAYCKDLAAPNKAGDSTALMTHTGMSFK
jgi:hypothetical protein